MCAHPPCAKVAEGRGTVRSEAQQEGVWTEAVAEEPAAQEAEASRPSPQLSGGQDSGPLLTVPLPQHHAACHPICE